MTEPRPPKTYLLTWNPDGYHWPTDVLTKLKAALAEGPVADTWSTGNTTSIQPGDRFYLLRLGQEPKGIFASGRITSAASRAPHWDPVRASAGDTYNQVDIAIETLLNPWEKRILDHAQLERLLPEVNWSPQASGTSVPSSLVSTLDAAWEAILAGQEPLPKDYEDARRRIEAMLPDSERRPQQLEVIRETLIHAHEQGDANWNVTLRTSSIRVNAGQVQVLWLRHRGLRIGCDSRLLPPDSDLQRVDNEGFVKFPHVQEVDVAWADVARVYPRVRDAHFRFIEEAGRTRCPYRRAHSFGLTRYLAEQTGQDVPNPRIPRSKARAAFWKLSPGPNAFLWDDWVENGYASIGWNELGDLSELDKDQFDARVTEALARHPDWKRGGLEQVWKFRDLKPGDRIVANKGTSLVLGIGTVMSDYYFAHDAKDPQGAHRVDVAWDDRTTRAVDKGGWRRTLIKLKRPEFTRILQPPEPEPTTTVPPQEGEGFSDIVSAIENEKLYFPEETIANVLLALQTKRFVILTGISGTGKTQLARAIAKHFTPETEVATEARSTVADGSVPVVIKPSMRKYSRLVVPAQLAKSFLAGREENAEVRWLPLELPDGTKMKTAAYTREGTTLVQLLFRGAAVEWVRSKAEGDRIWLVREDDPEPVGTLKIMEEPATEDGDGAPTLGQPAYEVIAVRPDWNDNTGLLGFFNPLTKAYTAPAFLRLALAAHDERVAARADDRPPAPHFAILDEMNLARVEHYFSDVLSAMESGEPIELHTDDATAEGETDDGFAVPKRLVLPPNLFLVGTVNVDETTYMFSPKVLDRAFTIEFNEVTLERLGIEEDADVGREETPITLDKFAGDLLFLHPQGLDDWKAFSALVHGELHGHLLSLNHILEAENRHFGYRVAREIARFVMRAAQQSSKREEAAHAAFDLAILQKVLPKLHGTQQELEPLLLGLFRFAVGAEDGEPDHYRPVDGRLAPRSDEPHPPPRFPRTATKLWRMCRRLRQRGFVSFIE